MAFYTDIAFAGSLGAGESYMRGEWTCDDLTGLVKLLLTNRHVLDSMDGGLGRLATPIHKLIHWLNKNTRSGSRKNIEAHYDLGNHLFKLFLDKTMMYSCGVFANENASMYEASVLKLDIICQKLALSEQDQVVEIGTGWGQFAIHAAKHYGCHVTTTTISEEQYQYVKNRIQEEGLSQKITLLKKDYRDLEGQYDKLVSIEMIEAIGHHYMDTYFKKCSDLLKPNGMMLIQAITIADQRYKSALRSIDFIQRYIFPGSFIPSISAMTDAVARKTDMKLFHLDDIGPHYATTLRKWREQFFANIAQVEKLGYGEQFIRMWEFYFCYCEGGFAERALGDAHLLFVKPMNRRLPLVHSGLAFALADQTEGMATA
jgi:cyclopropane-fatty-acyl-phospholipid synthase